MGTSRVIFTINDEMKSDLERVAKERGANVSSLMRLFIAEKLSAVTHKPIEVYEVRTGGNRQKDDSE